MTSNFDFLSKDRKYKELLIACKEAESSFAISNSVVALQTRRALEVAVKWVYRYDSDLEVPYQDNLSSLIHNYQFKQVVDQKLQKPIQFIVTLGNKAAHTARPVGRTQAVVALRNLFDFMSWIDYSYSTEQSNISFDTSLLVDGYELEKKSKKIQQELAAKEAELRAKDKKLTEVLKSVEEREAHSSKRKENSKSRNFTCDDMSEYTTRKVYIDLALEMAGWTLHTDCLEEVEVAGMPSSSGVGFVDYVLYGANGKPLAVVEAKRTSVDPHKGKIQAKLYADCLEKEHGVRPFIFFTNGFETWFWDDCSYPERKVAGFFSREELDWILFQRNHKQPLKNITINDAISNRPYQKQAIQAVCDTFEQGQRKALLVMATGSGKTRTAISLVDVLMQMGWVKHTLFLADRRELVKQAKKNFVALLPNLSVCNLLDSKDDPNSRMVFSTYPTMMNAIDSTKSDTGSQLFTPGHFDLIIVDESHRSIYKKYQDIFTYFDGMLLGLTATPKSDIDHNTYSIFDLESGVPTYAYELDEAIKDKYLVPYDTLETKLKFMEEGIFYDELSDAEKEHWEETFDDDSKRVVRSAEMNKFLFNSSTVDIVLNDLITKGIKVHGGDRVGKTIIFAQSTKHADFILQRFNTLYPHYKGAFAATIYNGIKYVDSLIEDLSEKEKMPQIAISVDMLDTGIDIPELVNLVFFKKVRSRSKFWQMIGRGTRLCEDLFGIGKHKRGFRIFDYCGNFEYFRIDKNGTEGKATMSLTEKLFMVRVRIAQALQHATFQTADYAAHRDRLVEELFSLVDALDITHFSHRLRQEYIDKYNKKDMWENISDTMVYELEEHIAPLILPQEGDELAKRFDYLMYTIELADLQGFNAVKQKQTVVSTAEQLESKGNISQIKFHAELIKQIQTDEFWQDANLHTFENVRTALRDLLVLIDKEKTGIYYSSFKDKVMEVAESGGIYTPHDMQDYRKKVNNYLQEHRNDLVVHKLRSNLPLTTSDYKHLETLLWRDLGTKEEYTETFGSEPLMVLVAKLVGLEQEAANKLFSEFLSDQSLNSNQMAFVKLVVNHVIENGMIDKELFNSHPFNQYGSIISLFDGKIDKVKGLVQVIDELNNRVNIG